ncbi:hypothetical protein F5I97DRAFT_1927183 [Phlebopus sp. FC_14]|nr:hypothetical protein F5I97DRAFT_1927183 [Phlebopus sp. FC_14]
MADAGFFKGTSTDQDRRFSDKELKLLKTMKFPPEFDKKVDMKKVNLTVIKPWIAKKVTELVGFEDEVVVEYAMGLLEDPNHTTPDPKKMQINLTGFLTSSTSAFMISLWSLLLEAQESPAGVPKSFVEEKKEEMRKAREERTNEGIVQSAAEEAEAEAEAVAEVVSKEVEEAETMGGEDAVVGAPFFFTVSSLLSSPLTIWFPFRCTKFPLAASFPPPVSHSSYQTYLTHTFKVQLAPHSSLEDTLASSPPIASSSQSLNNAFTPPSQTFSLCHASSTIPFALPTTKPKTKTLPFVFAVPSPSSPRARRRNSPPRPRSPPPRRKDSRERDRDPGARDKRRKRRSLSPADMDIDKNGDRSMNREPNLPQNSMGELKIKGQANTRKSKWDDEDAMASSSVDDGTRQDLEKRENELKERALRNKVMRSRKGSGGAVASSG